MNNRRERVGWYIYDWANSAFYTTVITVFLGPYLTGIARAAAESLGEGNTFVYPFGIRVFYGSFFPYVVALSVGLQMVFLPILGAIADYSHRKKQMLALFAYIGSFATMGLYFLQGTNYLLGGGLLVLANLSYGAAIVFYNSFLPDIASAEDRDRVSSIGWAIGYLGGGLLLALNLYLFSKAESFGLTTSEAVRISLASSGAWWAAFTLVSISSLRNRLPVKEPPPGQHLIATGFKQLVHTVRTARQYPHTLLFLVAYLLYNDAIQAVIALASVFGAEELKLEQSTLVQVILMVQFAAFFGALLFNWVATRTGNKRAIMISLVIWTGVLVYAYGLLQTKLQFFLLGAVIAVVLGGSQALSRSVYSLMIPKGHEAEYFSLYEVSDKGTSWMAPLMFGLALQVTRSYRVAILSLVVFFVAGLAVLAKVNVRRAAIDAGNEPLPEA
ncbi:MAG TPA: MFS transporter [Blastocatellia bacterium]|nr:MFS transporter [Blastocatellia bacterium]